MYHKWIDQTDNDCHPPDTHPLAMQNVFLTFVIITMALVLSLIILVFELIFPARHPSTADVTEFGNRNDSTNGVSGEFESAAFEEFDERGERHGNVECFDAAENENTT